MSERNDEKMKEYLGRYSNVRLLFGESYFYTDNLSVLSRSTYKEGLFLMMTNM